MKKTAIILFEVVATLQFVYSQPANYSWDRFGQGNATMTTDSPVPGKISNTTQAAYTSTYYLVQWDNYWNKWSNTSTPYNQEFTLTWGGGTESGPDGALSVATTINRFYTLQIDGLDFSNRQAVLMETDNAPQSFHQTPSIAVSTPVTVYPGQDAVINISLAGNKSSQEKVFVRYSADNWSTSKVVEASGSGNLWSEATATIPVTDNTLGSMIKYYAYSTTVAATNLSNHDLIALKMATNGGANYSYTVADSWITTADGNWTSPSTWLGGVVPPNDQPITIDNGVILDQDATVSSLTINPRKTFTASRTLSISPGGTLINNDGTFLFEDGTLVKFDGSGTISGTFYFCNVSIAGGVNFGSSSFITKSLTIDKGGFVVENAPTYEGVHATVTTLIYNTGTTYGRGLEWRPQGDGWPGEMSVRISNNTILDMGANSGGGKSFTCYGNLTVDVGSTFAMNMSANTAAVGVNYDVINNGTITLSGSSGGDLYISGGLVNNGTFNANNRTIGFYDNTMHNYMYIGGSVPFEIPYLIVSSWMGGFDLQTDLTVSGGSNGGNALSFESAFFNLNGHTLTIGKPGVASTCSSGYYCKIIGGPNSSIIVLGTGPLGMLYVNKLQNLIVDRTSGGSVTIGNSLEVLGNLTTTNGKIIIPSLSHDYYNTGISLIQNSENVSATVELDVSAWTDVNHGWHFLSSPIADQAIDPAFTNITPANYYFYSWWEPTNEWVNFENTDVAPDWNTANVLGAISGGGNFIPGKGYFVAYADSDTRSFTGLLNNADVAINNLGITPSTAVNKGFHLLGNPFPSALTWATSEWSLNHINSTAKVWNESTAAYLDILPGTGIIPAMNGFMVEVSPTFSGNNSLVIPKSARVFDPTLWYKSVENQSIVLVANDLTGRIAQESRICINSEATASFDPKFDSHFLAGYAPKFYSLVGNERLSTNTLPDIPVESVIPLGFVKNDAVNFSIELKQSIEGYTIYLKDQKTNMDQNLSDNPVYTFTSEADDDPNRFLFHFINTTGIVDRNLEPIKVYATGGKIYINGAINQSEIIVRNMIGQIVLWDKNKGNSLTTLNANSLPNGVYVVSLVGNNKVTSIKVVINK